MPIKKILKIVGFIFVPLLPMVVAAYFLFPYINEEEHKEVAKKYDDEVIISDTTELGAVGDSGVDDIGGDYARLKQRAKVFYQNITELRGQLDSLKVVNDSLKQTLEAKDKELAERNNQESQSGDSIDAQLVADNTDISEEEFSENIKSLLDLDVENLTPIVNKMSNDQLVRIFRAGSGLQRKKLLRSLESDRAAKLMTEVM